jgi:hypothetical protein
MDLNLYYDMLDFYGNPEKYLKPDLTDEEKTDKLESHRKRLDALRGMKKEG